MGLENSQDWSRRAKVSGNKHGIQIIWQVLGYMKTYLDDYQMNNWHSY